MPLTTRGLAYTNATTLAALSSNTDLKLNFSNNAAMDEVETLFQALQSARITSLELTYTYDEDHEATRVNSVIFRHLAAFIATQGEHLHCFKIKLDLSFRENDEFEETLLDDLSPLVTSASALTKLHQCSWSIQSRGEIGSCAMFDTMVDFLSATPMPHLLSDLALNLQNVNTASDDDEDEVSSHSRLNDFLEKCSNLTHAQINFSNWSFGLYHLILLLSHPALKTMNVKLTGSFFRTSEANTEGGLLLEKQIPFLAKMIQQHLFLTTFTFDVDLTQWIAAHPERGLKLRSMLELAAQNPSIQQLCVNFGKTLTFNALAAESILSLFKKNTQLTNLELLNLPSDKEMDYHNIAVRNQIHLNDLLSVSPRFHLHNLPAELFTLGNLIDRWSELECKAHDILLYFYFANLPLKEMEPYQYYFSFILAAAVSQAMLDETISQDSQEAKPTLSSLPDSAQAHIAEYLDRSTMRTLLNVSGGFFTQLKRELPALQAIYRKTAAAITLS